MNEPERLLASSGTKLEQLVLRAGRAERPNAVARRRGALAIAVATQAGWARTAWAKSVLALTSSGKIVGIGAGVVATGTVLWVVEPAFRAIPSEHGAPSQSVSWSQKPMGHGASVPRLSAHEAEVSPIVSPTKDSPASAKSTSSSSAVRSRGPAEGTVKAETESLDLARREVQRGAPDRALSVLDKYTLNFPKGLLRQEATLLRIEALLRSGRREPARALARRFLAAHPSGPYAGRVESLLKE